MITPSAAPTTVVPDSSITARRTCGSIPASCQLHHVSSALTGGLPCTCTADMGSEQNPSSNVLAAMTPKLVPVFVLVYMLCNLPSRDF